MHNPSMEEEQCNTALALGIGGGGARDSDAHHAGDCPVQFHILFPPRVKEEEGEVITTTTKEEGNIAASRSKLYDEKEDDDAAKDASSDDGSSKGSARKKLRLSIAQSALLEDSFRAHNNLTAAQKQELAERSNLRPRQVEVWFQNRRARTKLKQMEVDCDFLKKCCHSLSDENRMLKRELQEFRAAKTVGSPLYIHPPKVAALSKSPSCERIGAPGGSQAGAMEGGVEKPKLLGVGGAKDEGMIGLC